MEPNRTTSGKSKTDSGEQILQKIPFRIVEVTSITIFKYYR
jgi:hypothetical protein